MDHATYGLTMRDELWRAHCGCGWNSVPSPDLTAGTAELDGHLRAVVSADQRPGRLAGLALTSALRLVDHTLAVSALAVGVALTGALLGRGLRRVA